MLPDTHKDHNRAMRGIAGRLGLSDSEYRDTLEAATGKRHVSDMTVNEVKAARAHFDTLAEQCGVGFKKRSYMGWSLDRSVSDKQLRRLRVSVSIAESEGRLASLAGFMRRQFEPEKTLTKKDISGLIVAIDKLEAKKKTGRVVVY